MASVGKSPAKLGDIIGDLDLNQTLDWSGKFYGMPDNLEKIIETQQYDVRPEQVLTVLGGTNMGIYLTCMAVLKPGDEVICETPAWGEVPSICSRLGIDLKYWWLRHENKPPTLHRIRKRFRPKAKLPGRTFKKKCRR